MTHPRHLYVKCKSLTPAIDRCQTLTLDIYKRYVSTECESINLDYMTFIEPVSSVKCKSLTP